MTGHPQKITNFPCVMERVSSDAQSKQTSEKHEPKPKIIGSYTIPPGAKLLGRGSYGEVRLGHATDDLEQKVAVKMASAMSTKEKVNDTIGNEIDIMAVLVLSGCANLVKILYAEAEIFGDELKFSLVMEYCTTDLRRLMKKKKFLVGPELAHLTRELAAGLEAMRSFNVMHRDLKPGNIFAYHSGTEWSHLWQLTFKIGDFGLSRIVKPQEKLFMIGGSKNFYAPEVVRGHGGDHLSDLWSLGITLYLSSCGRYPMPLENCDIGEIEEIMNRTKIDFEWILDKSAKNMLMRLLKKNPSKRMTLEDLKGHPLLRSDEPFRSGRMSVEEVKASVKKMEQEAMDKFTIRCSQESIAPKRKSLFGSVLLTCCGK